MKVESYFNTNKLIDILFYYPRLKKNNLEKQSFKASIASTDKEGARVEKWLNIPLNSSHWFKWKNVQYTHPTWLADKNHNTNTGINKVYS